MRNKVSKSDFTFLTKEQIDGPDKLEIFKKTSPEAEISDFSVLTGLYTRWDLRNILDKNRE